MPRISSALLPLSLSSPSFRGALCLCGYPHLDGVKETRICSFWGKGTKEFLKLDFLP